MHSDVHVTLKYKKKTTKRKNSAIQHAQQVMSQVHTQIA